MSGLAPRLRDRIGGGRAIALIDGNSFCCSCERVFDPKLANPIAKRIAPLDGVCDLADPAEYDHWLRRIPAAEVWGIGRASLAKLEAMGVDSVADLADLDPRPVRKALTGVGEHIIHELRGLSCLPLGTLPAQRKGCALTRSFSTRIEDRATLEQAVSAHATSLGEKLRREGLGTNQVSVFYHTSEHERGPPMRSVSTTVTLPEATSDTLRRSRRLGHRYRDCRHFR